MLSCLRLALGGSDAARGGLARASVCVSQGLEEFVVIVENKDKQQVPIKQQEVLNIVGQLEECMVDGFPFEVRDTRTPPLPLPTR